MEENEKNIPATPVPETENGVTTEATPAAAASPAQAPADAAEQAAPAPAPKAEAPARPAPRPAAAKPAPKPAVNEIKPELVAPEQLHDRLAELKNQGYALLENLTGVDWGEEGLGAVYTLTNPETFEMVHVKAVSPNREQPVLPSACDLWDIANFYEREVYASTA